MEWGELKKKIKLLKEKLKWRELKKKEDIPKNNTWNGSLKFGGGRDFGGKRERLST